MQNKERLINNLKEEDEEIAFYIISQVLEDSLKSRTETIKAAIKKSK